MSLEAFQSGLSWITILRKRPAFRAAFADFSIPAVAAFTERDAARLMADAGIVRNRMKVDATLHNARVAVGLPDGLTALLWSYAPAAAAPARDPGGRPGDHPRVDRAGQGPEEARLQVRRPDHRLRPDAGDRHGGRPPRRLLRGAGGTLTHRCGGPSAPLRGPRVRVDSRGHPSHLRTVPAVLCRRKARARVTGGPPGGP
nr:hypothetical protein GCM10020092_009450 [Actinoplanes digitatis]